MEGVIQTYESVQKFGYRLFAQNLKDTNPVLSPISAYLALAMAGCGAYGPTKEEFYYLLGKNMQVSIIDMMNALPAEGNQLTLSFANSAWIDDKFFLNSTWTSAIRCLMDAEAFQTALSSTDTMNVINRWTAVKTRGLIDQVLQEPIAPETKFALLNTVYFKGNWMVPFKPYSTRKEEFYLDKGRNETVQVNMMGMCEHLPGGGLDYIADDFTEGVILPYENNEGASSALAFVALKPKGKFNIHNISSRLTSGVIKNLLAGRRQMELELKLPKFEITFDRILNKSLANMGLLRCFDRKRANLSRIGRAVRYGDPFYIDFVRQKAKIRVDEKGTEAAAATELLAPLSAWKPQKRLYFNEPFLYMIMDMTRQIPLFIGILDNPVA